jgi:hypothetical protein
MAKKDKNVAVKEKESGATEIIRKFKQSPGLYIGSVLILVLVTVTFVVGDAFFSGPRGGTGNDLTFGFYDKEPITWIPDSVFALNREQAERYYQAQGYDVNNFSIAAQIWRQSFEATVVHTAVLQIMKRSNYSVPEKTVNRQVAQMEQFQENGRFSAALYNQMPESSRASIWRQLQNEIIKTNFFVDYYFGLLMPSAEAEFIGNMSSVLRSFEMVSFPVDAYPEDEYLSYARANPDLFRTIHLSRITINSSERETKRILDSIINGATTFEDAARGQSQDTFADRGGDMGSRYTFELDTEIPNPADRENIFNLRAGEISNVIRVDDRWMIYRVEEALKPANFDDYATMERVRSYLRNFERGRMEDWAIAQANEFINEVKISGFDDAALYRNLGKSFFGPLPINFGGIELFTSLESFEISGIPQQDAQSLSSNENFWRIAFSTPLNTPSEPLVQGSNVLVLLPVEQINAEESYSEYITSMYPSWINNIFEQSLQYYFLHNSRMDDRFWETYFRYFMP